MSSGAAFVETLQYRRFVEFCDACGRDRYIGLCYGPPGVGKTLSARRYANGSTEAHATADDQEEAGSGALGGAVDVVLYTPPVVNSPAQVERDIARARSGRRARLVEQVRREQGWLLDAARDRYHRQVALHRESAEQADGAQVAEMEYVDAYAEMTRRVSGVMDPTRLVVVDEADRLRMTGLEQLRDIFDRGGIGLILIGMPGIEKRMARYPQLHSRVGFVHEFRPLDPPEVRRLLRQHWLPPGLHIPADRFDDEEGVAAILRSTGGNFRLLHRLLTQIARILEINELDRVTGAVVEAARESLVIGTD